MPIKVEKNLVYAETISEKLTADVYLPQEGEEIAPVLLIHGGAYQSGSKEMYREWGKMLADAGFAAIAINYRLAGPNNPSWPGVLEDVQQAANWIVANANSWNVEPMRMGIIGDSAGAHLGALFSLKSMTCSSFNVLGCIGVYGIYDLTKPASDREAAMFQKLLGKSIREDPEIYHEASPKTLLRRAASSPTFDTKFLLIWGDSDPIASPTHSIDFVQQLEEAEIEVETLTFKGQGHFWFNDTPGLPGGKLSDHPNIEAAPRIVKFLNEKLFHGSLCKISAKQVDRLNALSNQNVKSK